MPTPVKQAAKKGPLVASWSWSRYAIYNECPFKFKCKFIDKLEEPAGPAMARGRTIHDLADNFVRGNVKKMPAELKSFSEEFKMLKKVGAVTEADARIGLDRTWKPVDYFDWTHCWLRVVIDAKYKKKVGRSTRRLVVIDHKTGKIYGENLEQMDLTATSALCADQEVDEVEVQLWYLDQGVQMPEKPRVYGRDGNDRQVVQWNKRVFPMLTDKTFVPKPNQNCRRCHYRKGNGGPCKF